MLFFSFDLYGDNRVLHVLTHSFPTRLSSYLIVGLGLIYDVEVGEGGVVRITMTTTTPGCPATSYMMDGARDAALSVSGVECVEVKLTHAPRWTPDMMREEATAKLGIRSGGG